MTNSAKKAQRTRFLIYPRYQLTIVGFHVIILLGALGAVAYKVHRSFDHLMRLGHEAQLAPNHPYFNFLTLQSKEVMGGMAAVAAIAIALSALLSLLLSHRLVGPVVRLRQFFKGVASADRSELQRLQFRDKDYFEDLPETINEALERLKKSA